MRMKTAAMTLVYVFILSVMVGGLLLAPMATASTISATVDIQPDKINLSDPPSSWDSPSVSAFIQFPKKISTRIRDIDVSTVLLDGVIPAVKGEVTSRGKEGGGQWYKAYFDRYVVQNYLWLKLYHMGYFAPFKNVQVELTVKGNLYDGTPFQGSDTILVSAK